MQWEKASKNALIFVMLRSMMLIAAVILFGLQTDNSITAFIFLLIGIAGAVGLRNAYVLDDTPGPIMSIGPQGMVISPALSAGRLIPWDDVKSIKNQTLRAYFVIPLYSRLIIRVRGRHYLSSFQLLGQFGWLSSAITIPAAYFKDGTGATLLMKARCETMREQSRHAQVIGQFGNAQFGAPQFGASHFGNAPFGQTISDGSVTGTALTAAGFGAPMGIPATAQSAQVAADSDHRPDLDAAVARYMARRAVETTALDGLAMGGQPSAPLPVAPVRTMRTQADTPAAPYTPPGSPDYVPRRPATTPEPLLNGKPFPKDDRPVFGRRSL